MSFPALPFDGQRLIDFNRITWEYNAEEKVWNKIGRATEIPLASRDQIGLLNWKHKKLLDGISVRGGHFGILTKPLLSLAIVNPTPEFTATVTWSQTIASGTRITIADTLVKESLGGYILEFNDGTYEAQRFMIFTNDEYTIDIEGDILETLTKDNFSVYKPTEIDPNGIIHGNVQFVSDSLDIECVDTHGNKMTGECGKYAYQDGTVPPGIDFSINDTFLKMFCVQVPGCQGPPGAVGLTGYKGVDGTGDGPQGDVGDKGVDVDIPTIFSGIKIQDTSIISDTAIIDLEIDQDAGKIYATKGNVKVPTDDTLANKVIASQLMRSVQFTNDKDFAYKIQKPIYDSVKDNIEIGVYPEGFEISNSSDENKPLDTQINATKLNDVIDSMIGVLITKYNEVKTSMNKTIREFIENKDAEARAILSNLANEVAECEWLMPLEYCIDIRDCYDESIVSNDSCGNLIDEIGLTSHGIHLTNPICEDLGLLTIDTWDAYGGHEQNPAAVYYPNYTEYKKMQLPMAMPMVPDGIYVLEYVNGAISFSGYPEFGWRVARPESGPGFGVAVKYKRPGGSYNYQFPVVTTTDIMNKDAVITDYQNASLADRTAIVEVTGAGGLNISGSEVYSSMNRGHRIFLTLSCPPGAYKPGGKGTSIKGKVQVRVYRIYEGL